MLDKKLDKKYRPKIFSEVLGQEGTIKVLRNTLKNIDQQVVPSIFFGPWGSGKTTLARIYSKAILCQDKSSDGDPCGRCDSCDMISRGVHPGFVEIDGANINKVDDFRHILESTLYKVAGSDHRVFLIDECHMMSTASQNLFLKPLEEGIPNVHWFFCTTEYRKIIDTIRSRCTDYGIRPISHKSLLQRVIEICKAECIPYDENAIDAIIQAKNGHFRDVLVFINQIMDVGGIVSDIVYDYLNIGAHDAYFEILATIKDTPEKSFEVLDNVLTQVSAQDVYNGLISAAMDTYKASKNIRCTLIIKDVIHRNQVYTIYRDSVVQLAQYLIDHGNRRIDNDYLITTLLLLRNTLISGIEVTLKETPIIKTVIEKASDPITYKIQPLTDLDEKAKKKPKQNVDIYQKTGIIHNEDKILSETEFSVMLQRGI